MWMTTRDEGICGKGAEEIGPYRVAQVSNAMALMAVAGLVGYQVSFTRLSSISEAISSASWLKSSASMP